MVAGPVLVPELVATAPSSMAVVLPEARPEISWMRIVQPKLSIVPLMVAVMVGFVPTSPAGVSMANTPV